MVLRKALVPHLFEIDEDDVGVASGQMPEDLSQRVRRRQPRCHVGGETEDAEQPATPTGTCAALPLCLIGAEGAVALALIDVLSPEIGAEARQVVRTERGQEIRAR